jgi:hypothetical protein
MSTNNKMVAWVFATIVLLGFSGQRAEAEPYLAVQKGMQCSSCHVHPAGGGKRTVYGNVFAQSELAVRRLGDGELWTGEINKWLSIGGDLRASFESIDTPNRRSTTDTDFRRGTFYLQATLIPNRLSIYVDHQFSPDGLENLEAYVRLNSKNTKWFVTAGDFYLPYGLRLQDDSAFVRQATGINFANTDRGLQGGYESGAWSTIASITDGSGAGRDTLNKQVSVVSSYVQPMWRAGASASVSDDDAGDRTMFGGLLEANWAIRKGHNLKFGYDYLDPNNDVSEDQQVRFSLIWEYSPIQFVQTRVGYRLYDGIPQVDAQNREVIFVELHGFF